jgi:hypothetical protein
MKDAMKENNRLRNQQMGNRKIDELTKREHIAALALQGLLANGSRLYDNDQEIVDEAVYITDLLIEKLNQN